jgi:hypothetical protein
VRKILAATCLASVVGLHPSPGAAQSDYRNTDSGRPLRIEDAEATERYALEFSFAPFRLERPRAGIERWQYEPRLSYGIFPRTEIELRAPIVYRELGASPRSGLAGLGIGVFRNINSETPSLPSFALGGEYVVPAGGAATKPGSWVVRGAATRSFLLGRVHVNAAYGSYNSIAVPAPSSTCTQNCGGITFIPINDGPCELEPGDGGRLQSASLMAPMDQLTPPPTAQQPTITTGRRLLVGIAGDHSFPLWSTMIGADVFVERFSLSTSPADWSAELGARHQVTPRVVFDVGVGRRFTGTSPSWFATVGSSYSFTTGGAGLHGNCP